MRKTLLIALLLALWPSASSAAQSIPCGPTAVPIASSLALTTYSDSTVVDGQTYFYTVTANNSVGASACSNITPAAVIPTTGTHSVTLNWTASTTSGVTYSVFRAQAPAPPTNLTVTVN